MKTMQMNTFIHSTNTIKEVLHARHYTWVLDIWLYNTEQSILPLM